mgnify:CR=1 FL=1
MTNAGAGMIGIMWRMDIWCGNQGIPPGREKPVEHDVARYPIGSGPCGGKGAKVVRSSSLMLSKQSCNLKLTVIAI